MLLTSLGSMSGDRRRRAVWIALLVALTGCRTRWPAAQPVSPGWNTVQSLAPGTEVRVQVGDEIHTGRIESVAPDALVLRVGKASMPFVRQDIERVYERVVVGSRKRVTNILLGVASWTALAGLMIAATETDHGKEVVRNCAVIGAVAGAIYPTRFYQERVVYIRR